MKYEPEQIEIETQALHPQFLSVGEADARRRIAFLHRCARSEAARANIIWLGGFRSDMGSTKASFLDAWAAREGRGCLRFDYSGHGLSEGRFEAGTIGLWLEETLAILRSVSEGPQILIGSSMGGWLALLCARALAATGETSRLQGLVLIAPAVDFTEKLIFERLPPDARQQLDKDGVWMRASAYASAPYPITRGLIEEGRRHLLFGQTIRTHCPVHILQGMRDEDVPWQHAMMLVEHLAGDPVVLTLIKDGEHRLSRDEDLGRLQQAIAAMG
ncbi:carboxylesterase [Methylovirgula sp. HY1]|uniref:alpha/beta hydrolase n=1 Tax=Methylovirgula sp. HY1 TaxID=2822761 RepID=UPI001C75D605|nr:alpha/beta hydrolase [Methylovirgula sp. HY1]QXX75806.1 2-succinyl-6-hydroxy-2,4-cyclohexadiene-1-carboxylate synthase [Methylovirgula sp. HY1]